MKGAAENHSSDPEPGKPQFALEMTTEASTDMNQIMG